VLVYSLTDEPSLTLRDTCGNLIDKLTSICVGEPEFLSPETSRRYLHLLPNFKDFVFSVPYLTRRAILVGQQKELQYSHIVPAFAVRWLKATSLTGYLKSPESKKRSEFTCSVLTANSF
jgi:hypothetical protein